MDAMLNESGSQWKHPPHEGIAAEYFPQRQTANHSFSQPQLPFPITLAFWKREFSLTDSPQACGVGCDAAGG